GRPPAPAAPLRRTATAAGPLRPVPPTFLNGRSLPLALPVVSTAAATSAAPAAIPNAGGPLPALAPVRPAAAGPGTTAPRRPSRVLRRPAPPLPKRRRDRLARLQWPAAGLRRLASAGSIFPARHPRIVPN